MLGRFLSILLVAFVLIIETACTDQSGWEHFEDSSSLKYTARVKKLTFSEDSNYRRLLGDLSESILNSAGPTTSDFIVSDLSRAKPYAYVVRFSAPILQYRPNGSLSSSIGSADASVFAPGMTTFDIVGGDGPCDGSALGSADKQLGKGKGKGINTYVANRTGSLTIGCDGGIGESVDVQEVSLCFYQVTWLSPEFC